MRHAVTFLLVACAAIVAAPDAEACSSNPMGETRVLPLDGSSNVSTATSIVVLAGLQPPEITLRAAGSDVALPPPVALGTVMPGRGVAWRWSLPEFLEASTSYEVHGPPTWTSVAVEPVTPVKLAQFTTAAGYDKVEGTPPGIGSLKLWRVRYPKDDILAGQCVFSEYHGFAQLELEPAVVPNAAPAGTLYTLTIEPEHGGASQTILFTGDSPYTGRDPTGSPYPLSSSEWFLELDPTRRHCASLTAAGDGDLARLPLRSEWSCASVEVMCLPGSESNGPDPTCPAGSEPSSGCSASATTPSVAESSFIAFWLLLAVLRLSGSRRARSASVR